MITIRPPVAPEKQTWVYELTTMRNPAVTTLLLKRPYLGFFTTPAFFANWQTNASNEMRVTLNQTLIVATGAQIDGTDTTTPTSTPGLDAAHANQQACVYCHQTLDPTRSIFAATYSWNYGTQLDTTWSSQKGRFIFQGVQQDLSTIDDLGTILSTHPLLAGAWVQKLCYFVNSQECEPTDPEYQRLSDAVLDLELRVGRHGQGARHLAAHYPRVDHAHGHDRWRSGRRSSPRPPLQHVERAVRLRRHLQPRRDAAVSTVELGQADHPRSAL